MDAEAASWMPGALTHQGRDAAAAAEAGEPEDHPSRNHDHLGSNAVSSAWTFKIWIEFRVVARPVAAHTLVTV